MSSHDAVQSLGTRAVEAKGSPTRLILHPGTNPAATAWVPDGAPTGTVALTQLLALRWAADTTESGHETHGKQQQQNSSKHLGPTHCYTAPNTYLTAQTLVTDQPSAVYCLSTRFSHGCDSNDKNTHPNALTGYDAPCSDTWPLVNRKKWPPKRRHALFCCCCSTNAFRSGSLASKTCCLLNNAMSWWNRTRNLYYYNICNVLYIFVEDLLVTSRLRSCGLMLAIHNSRVQTITRKNVSRNPLSDVCLLQFIQHASCTSQSGHHLHWWPLIRHSVAGTAPTAEQPAVRPSHGQTVQCYQQTLDKFPSNEASWG